MPLLLSLCICDTLKSLQGERIKSQPYYLAATSFLSLRTLRSDWRASPTGTGWCPNSCSHWDTCRVPGGSSGCWRIRARYSHFSPETNGHPVRSRVCDVFSLPPMSCPTSPKRGCFLVEGEQCSDVKVCGL